MNELLRKIRYLFEALIAGDRPWGCVRLVFTILALVLGLLLFFVGFTPLVDTIFKVFRAIYHFILNLFPSPPPAPAGPYPPPPQGHVYPPPPSTFVQYMLDVWYALWVHRRYFVAFLAAITIAFFVGGRYVQDIYELASYRKGLRYVLTSVFGLLSYPSLEIAEGKMQLRADEVNTLREIGGPGFVIIRPGNIVLFERLRSPAAVRSAGKHFISRFESIKDVVPLEEQDGVWPESVASTKDGIEVRVKDIRFRYRLYPGRRYGGFTSRTWEEPYPFSPQSVKNYAYNRTIDEKGQTNSWFHTVKFIVDNAITDYVSSHTIDELTAPGATSDDPRGKIKQTIDSPRARKSLREMGAEILWCEIGHFEITDKRVSAQRLETWQMKWSGKADLVRAEGEARRLAYQELGRAEGQAEMLQSIARSLDELGLKKGEALSRVRSIVLIRTAQILEAMTERYHLPGGDTTGQSQAANNPELPKLPG
jgi:hypothetical protein